MNGGSGRVSGRATFCLSVQEEGFLCTFSSLINKMTLKVCLIMATSLGSEIRQIWDWVLGILLTLWKTGSLINLLGD